MKVPTRADLRNKLLTKIFLCLTLPTALLQFAFLIATEDQLANADESLRGQDLYWKSLSTTSAFELLIVIFGVAHVWLISKVVKVSPF